MEGFSESRCSQDSCHLLRKTLNLYNISRQKNKCRLPTSVRTWKMCLSKMAWNHRMIYVKQGLGHVLTTRSRTLSYSYTLLQSKFLWKAALENVCSFVCWWRVLGICFDAKVPHSISSGKVNLRGLSRFKTCITKLWDELDSYLEMLI